MNEDLERLLESLPTLNRNTAETRQCKICSNNSRVFGVVDFNKHCSTQAYQFGLAHVTVTYYRCASCKLIFTDLIDDWTPGQVSKFIYNADYAKVDPEYSGARAKRNADLMAHWLADSKHLRILDYGSGAGLFAEEMRKRGFGNFESYDPYSSPASPEGLFDLLTCFEAIEHSPNPLSIFRHMVERLTPGGKVLVGQTLQPENIEELGVSWWYIAPRNGHVSCYAEDTFLEIASRLDLVYFRGQELYGFARRHSLRTEDTLLKLVGPALSGRRLFAPGEEILTPMWHGIEKVGTRRFRWSATPNLEWRDLDLYSGTTRIQLQFVGEISVGFAKECVMQVDGKNIPTRVEAGQIIGELRIRKPKLCNISLRTPQPQSPLALRGEPDSRLLGLAVVCA